MVNLRPVIIRILTAGSGEVRCTSAQRLLHKHTMSTGLPGVEPLLYPPPYRVGCGDMLGSLQYNCLE